MQERIRFVEELHPGRPTYNAPSAHRLGGPLDVQKFKAALRDDHRAPALAAHRHRARPGHRRAGRADRERGGLRAAGRSTCATLPEDQREAELVERMHALAERPIDIHQRAACSTRRCSASPTNDHAFVFVPHHLVWDGWSFDVLQSELSAIYGALVRGEPHGLPPLAVTHGDYADWYAKWLTEPEFESQLRYWKDRFAELAHAQGAAHRHAAQGRHERPGRRALDQRRQGAHRAAARDRPAQRRHAQHADAGRLHPDDEQHHRQPRRSSSRRRCAAARRPSSSR